MNVIEFINSKSVARYLEKIKYEFNAIEAAYLVWRSKFTTLKEKFAAWQEIIDTMPDMAVKARRFGWETDEPSVHDFLKKYMRFVKEDIDKFYAAEEAYYTYCVLFENDTDWYDDKRIFSSLKLCEEEAMKEAAEDDAKLYSIKKIASDRRKHIECTFLKNGEIQDVYAVDPDDTDEKAEYMLRFEGLWFAFPMPFKRGDIVYQGNKYVYRGMEEKQPFVLLDISSWGEKELRENGYTDEKDIARCSRLIAMHKECGDESDMNACGYYMDDHGRMYWEHTTDNYLDLEYYDGELTGENRFLIALSNYEKKKIDISLLANAYKIFSDEFRGEYIKKYAYFTDEDLSRTGIK